ncbi:MAG: roadblock/LC7 domain-containing protein [Planctomycetes bacterium]|nr:roadblock/LC7 domain-containing protein [Planctomycetota bacterium]
MNDLLDQVNELNAVQGSMIITHDGILVQSAISSGLDDDTVAALSSSLVLTIKRAMEPMGVAAPPEEMVLSAELGKLAFFDLGNAYLVVVAEPQLKLNADLVEIRSVVRKLRARFQL